MLGAAVDAVVAPEAVEAVVARIAGVDTAVLFFSILLFL